jgi:uncharacterized protein YbcI
MNGQTALPQSQEGGAMEIQQLSRGGHLAASISNVVVRALAEHTGRGPTKARTTIGENVIVVVVQDALTKGERVLAAKGDAQAVLDIRKRYQVAMSDEVVAAIEQLTGRHVVAFMSDNHIDPDVAVEVFVLEPRSAVHEVQATGEVGDFEEPLDGVGPRDE